ncbi:MAG TPA: cytochrome c [Terracidiphilus sp.]|nr:cytochrome c [Terracidiphilus sp.]
MGRILVGILLGFVFFPFALLLYFQYGNPPLAVGDQPLFHEEDLTQAPLKYRVPREAPKNVPIPVSEENLVAGARIYREQCAVCHGLHGKPASIGSRMYPLAPPLWEHKNVEDAVGVSGDPAGETYWKISNGLRLSGMPAYQGVLSDMEIWQVSLLLANANKPLPPAALSLLKDQASQPSPQAAKASRSPKE